MKLSDLERKKILEAVNDLLNDKTLFNKSIRTEVSSVFAEMRRFFDDIVIELYNRKKANIILPKTRLEVFGIMNKYEKALLRKYGGE